MIKFKHKKHSPGIKHVDSKIVMYYSFSDFFLGTLLVILFAFFVNDYLSHRSIFESVDFIPAGLSV